MFDATELLKDLDAGNFTAKLTVILKETALSVAEHGGKGQVSITLDMKRIGETMQLAVAHKLAFKRPTKKGIAQGYDTDVAHLYANNKGELDFVPHSQLKLFKEEA
jgi:hypothetical protein